MKQRELVFALIPRHACTLYDHFNMPQIIQYTNLKALHVDRLHIVKTDGIRSRTTKTWIRDVFKYTKQHRESDSQ